MEKHPDSEITFSRHVDPTITDREPILFNDGKLLIVSPSFHGKLQMGCFHAKLLLIRFSDRLRVVISSANLTEEDWSLWSQCVWMQVCLINKLRDRTFSTLPKERNVLQRKNWIWNFARNWFSFYENARFLKSGSLTCFEMYSFRMSVCNWLLRFPKQFAGTE